LTAIERFEAALDLLDAVDGDPRARGWLHLRLALLLRFRDPPRDLGRLDTAQRLADDAADLGLAARVKIVRGMLRCHGGDARSGLADLKAGVEALEHLPPAEGSGYEAKPFVAFLNRGLYISWLALGGCPIEARAEGERFLGATLEPTDDLEDAVRSVGAWGGLSLAHAMLGNFAQAKRANAAARDASALLFRFRLFPPNVNGAYAYASLAYVADDPEERQGLLFDEQGLGGRQVRGQDFADPGNVDRFVQMPFYLLSGQWQEARQTAEVISATFASAPIVDTCSDVIGTIAHLRGDTELAWRMVRRVWPAGPTTEPGPRLLAAPMNVQRLAASLALDAGDLSTARAWLEAHDRWLAWSQVVRGRAEGQTLWAAYHRVAGNRDLAVHHARGALAEASAPRQPLPLLAVHRLLGRLATDARHHDEAQRQLREALALADACDAPFERALVLLVWAELHVAAGQTDEAELALAEARATCERLGAIPGLASADRLAVRLAQAARVSEVPPDGLTVREVEILRLVAKGLSNQEIADALSLSIHTVERHIANAYGKIGAHGRAAATAYVLHRLA
jgi:DNA-binding CsgD family transcriptional regulator